MEVKVAELRNQIDHLNRIVNVDFHACVGDAEKKRCLRMVQKVGGELIDMTCKRAKQDDIANKERAVDRSTDLLLTHSKLLK
jgi:hypothetical protein